MVLAVKIPYKLAHDVQTYLKTNNLFLKEYRALREKESITYAISKKFKKKFEGIEFVELNENDLPLAENKLSIKDILKHELNKDQLELLKTSYDVIGTIAILEVDEELRKSETAIAQAVLKTNTAIKTVLRKDGGHEGTFRAQKMKFLAGVDTKETIHIENAVRLKVNVETVYFSPRLSTERLRISELVKPNENILVMFSGAAPYPCVLAKKTQAKNIVGIEINPDGHKYGLENIKLNKIKKIKLFCGDVNAVTPTLEKQTGIKHFDRIIMPLPKTADEFLDAALFISKSQTIIHFYDFLHEDDFNKAEEKIADACKKNNMKYKKLGIYTCGCQGVRTYRICLDAEIFC